MTAPETFEWRWIIVRPTRRSGWRYRLLAERSRVAFEVIEVGERTFFRDGPAREGGEWIATDRANAGADTPRVESLLSAFPVVGGHRRIRSRRGLD